MTDDIILEISKQLGESRVSSEKKDLLSYTYDFWPISLHWILEKKFQKIPLAVVWPENTDEVEKLLKICYKNKTPIYPYGGGSGVLGGITPEKRGVVVDLKKMRNINVFKDDMLVEADAGVNGYYIEDYLNNIGFTLGNIPQSLYPSTVGGWISTKATGQFSTRYGGIEQMISGVEVVVPPGKTINLKPHPRTATGPDLRFLFVGSEGILGVITRAWLKIWPYPEKKVKLAFVSDTLKDALVSVKKILQMGARPAVVRIYDTVETKRHFYMFDDVFGKIATVMIVEGAEKIVDADVDVIKDCFIGKSVGEDLVDHWLKTRFNVKEAAEFVPLGVVFDTIEVAVVWSKAEDFYVNVVNSMKKVKGVLFASAHASHFYPQGVCFYFTFAGIPPRNSSHYDFYNKVWAAAMDATVANGGTISHHHGIGRQRINWMESELDGGFDLLKKVKRSIDEDDIMNPGNMGV